MRYIQYFEFNKGKLIEACGDKSVLIIDGRFRISRCHEEAREKNKIEMLHYNAYQIFEGASLNRSKPVTDIFKL